MKNILGLSILILLTISDSRAISNTSAFEQHKYHSVVDKRRKKHKIPAPIMISTTEALAPGGELIIRGSGFINNYPQGHLVYISNPRLERYRIPVIYSNANELHLITPENIPYGDYDLALKLKTKFLESPVNKSKSKLKLRPKAPKLEAQKNLVIEDLSNTGLSAYDLNGNELVYKLKSNLELGPNIITAHYYKDGYLSLASEDLELMLLPESMIDTKLQEINNEIFVRTKRNTNPIELAPNILRSEDLESIPTQRTVTLSTTTSRIKLSKYTQEESQDFSRELYVSSPTKPKYLSLKGFSSPIKIQELHVKSPESVLLYNRSSKTFPLAGCSLSDNITIRHTFFEPTSLAAGDPFLITKDLNLNDSGGDSLSLDCPCTHPIITLINSSALADNFEAPLCSASKVRLSSFSYSNLDANGYALSD